MSRRGWKGVAAVLAAAGVALTGSRDVRADLGPHGGLAPDHLGGCTACHRATASRRFDFGHDGVLRIPPGGRAILADPVARFCWVCHRAGNPYGARPIAGRALDAPGHGAPGGRSAVPEAWALGGAVEEEQDEGGLEGALRRRLTCTACHEVHVGAVPRLLRRSTAEGDYTGLCAACHPGRENAGLTGGKNVVVRDAVPYSTHPAAGPGAAGQGIPVCGDCHDVHRAPFPGEEPVAGLLRIDRGESASDLCHRCHEYPGPDGTDGHPMESSAAGRLPAGSLVTAEGVPEAWGAGRHFDRGASAPPPGEGSAPRCTSCHDIHGGLPGTSLLYGPAGGSGEGEDWCFSCHAREALVRLGHEAGEGLEGSDCAGCHGGPREGEPARWRAHGGFRAVRSLAEGGGAAGGGAGDVPQPGERIAAAPLGAVAGDPRPGARAQAASVLGAVAEPGEREPLLALVADPAAQVRAEAATALARTGDPRAAEALLPLLGDPEPEVRRSAISAFGMLRDPRAIPGLVRLLRDRDHRISVPARLALASLNDARALHAMVAGEERDWAAAAHLAGVLADLSDPGALPDVLLLLGHRNRVVRMAAASALVRYPGQASADALVRAFDDRDVSVKTAAAGSLIGLEDPRAASLLAGTLLDPSAHPYARRNMARGLGAIPRPEVVEPLIEALADPAARVREEANGSLFRLTCRNFGADQALWRKWWADQPRGERLPACR